MKTLVVCILCLLIAPLLSAQDAAPPDSPILSSVLSRGQLTCGIDEEVFGFGFLNPNTGDISGIQVDLCRAVAAALLGEAKAIDLRLHTLDDSLPAALAEGDLDLLFSHNFAFDIADLSSAGLSQGHAVIFYDGATVMVRSSTQVQDWPDLDAVTVCVQTDSPTALNFETELERHNVEVDLLDFGTIQEMSAAFFDGRCTALVLNRSLLEIIRQSSDTPADYSIWTRPFTLRPLTALYPAGDEQWTRIVDATLWGLIEAEALDVNSQNVDQLMLQSEETEDDYVARVGQPIAALLNNDLGLGLAPDFMVPVIREVGNYGEIYDRYLGPDSSLPIDRSLNELWFRGGLLSAPDWP